jgi:rhamnose utilization protein RhaD (predicted bifunctional aldolase and dehydrogenase)
MPDPLPVLDQLIALSRSLGDPARDLAILGEGNTSAKIDNTTFLVKASGKELRTADQHSFVTVSIPRALLALSAGPSADADVKNLLEAAKVDASDPAMPSVETFLHGYLLSLPGIQFVGHTHPIAVNSVMCSKYAKEAVSGRLFPDEIVCCGPAVCYIEYTDPGLVLARTLRERIERFIDEHNMAPKVILMQNHGFIAAGKSVRDVETITSMYVKTARVLLGTYALGGPQFLSSENVARIHTRPDEEYRQKQLGLK